MSKKWTTNKLKKNNVEKVDPQKVEQKTMSKKWTPKNFKKNNVEKVGSYILIYLHIPPYTLVYPRIPLYTFIYPHIHQNIEFGENDGQHKTQK